MINEQSLLTGMPGTNTSCISHFTTTFDNLQRVTWYSGLVTNIVYHTAPQGAQLYEKTAYEKTCNGWMTMKVTQGHGK